MSDESLFREVDEEVRQEQFKKLWAHYGNVIIGLCLLLIAVVGGYEGWKYWQRKQAETAGDRFFAAAELATAAKTDEALKQFGEIGHAGFAGLAKMREAAALAASGKIEEAVKIYDTVIADATADRTLRDLAQVRAAAALADTAAFADIEKRLKAFDAEGNAWRHVAREIMATVQWRLKDYAGADKMVQEILGDPETPAGVRQRTLILAQLLQPMVTKQ